MPPPLDPKRIGELEDLTGPTFGSILRSLERSIDRAIEEADGALAAGDLARAAYAAHQCQNDAMIAGASRLQEALAALESASRSFDPRQSSSALARVRELWPGAREELARAAERHAST